MRKDRIQQIIIVKGFILWFKQIKNNANKKNKKSNASEHLLQLVHTVKFIFRSITSCNNAPSFKRHI